MMIKITERVNGQMISRIVEEPDPVAGPVEPMPLTPRQFEWMLAYTGLDEVWASVESAAKDTDRELYANLRAQRASKTFLLEVTLSFVEEAREMAEQLHPDVDLSEQAIRDAWDQAASQSFDVLMPA